MTVIPVKHFPIERLREFSSRVFQHFGVPPADAEEAAGILAASDLRGIDSHGVARLRAYFEMLTLGRINPKPRITVLRETPSTASIDGDNGLGLVVGPWANRIAMEKAATAGTGWVSVGNSNHYGIAAWYVMEALKFDLIGWSMTNATRMVAPLWGAERMLGTNPIAIAFPGKEEPPIVIDMATCAVAFGKIEIARRKGIPIPEGWAIDGEGKATTDPVAMMMGGALLPLGSDRERGGHKGYALGIMVDVLCGVLGGANWGPFAPPFALRQQMPVRSVGKGIGHFFGAMRIDAFIDPDEFKRQIDDYVRTLRAAKPAPGTAGPLLPGDPEREAEAIRAREGVPLIGPVIDDLLDISKKTGIPLE
ncbi:MAG: malate dehydrogenase [Bryobacterales bacterium]|nr:malate dehydrogenase [Bryobacterales bacterium]